MTIGLFDRRRTILLVDADPHARAALRVALEAADFSVGEAANDREGERTALRIKPDAVIAELTLDAGDVGTTIAERLHASNSKIPCYILSSAGDALMFTFLNLPEQAFELLPIGALIGALMGLGNLAAGSELVVTRASGVSVWRIGWPVALA